MFTGRKNETFAAENDAANFLKLKKKNRGILSSNKINLPLFVFIQTYNKCINFDFLLKINAIKRKNFNKS